MLLLSAAVGADVVRTSHNLFTDSSQNIRILELLIWQAAVLQTALAFAVFIAFADGHDTL